MTEWINVNDRLPDSDKYCWVTLRLSGEVVITWYDPYELEWDSFGSSVIAWRYVEDKPEPYKPERKKSIKSVDVGEHYCCDCRHCGGKVLSKVYCNLYGCVADSCDAWEEVEDR